MNQIFDLYLINHGETSYSSEPVQGYGMRGKYSFFLDSKQTSSLFQQPLRPSKVIQGRKGDPSLKDKGY